MMDVKEFIITKKRPLLMVLAALIISALLAEIALNFYPKFFEIYDNPVVYIGIFMLVTALVYAGLVAISLIKAKKSALGYDDDVKAVLEIMDSLLEKLPHEEIDKFMKSKDAALYKKVLSKYNIK